MDDGSSKADHSAAIRGDAGEPPPTLPSTSARIIAFVAILAAGAAGGFIGYGVTNLSCRGDCTTSRGLGGLVGAVLAAIGVAVVVQLALRAMHEWRVLQAQGGGSSEQRPQRTKVSTRHPATRSRPRVR